MNLQVNVLLARMADMKLEEQGDNEKREDKYSKREYKYEATGNNFK